MSAPTFYTHNEIAGVISTIIEFKPFLLNFFGRSHITDDQQINFDRISPDRRLAPMVSPLVPGKVALTQGYKTSVFTPAYVKDKMSIDPNHVFSRRPGEPMGQRMSNSERYAAIMADKSRLLLERLLRRMELMAAQMLIEGKYTMTGEGVSYSVDFERPADNTVTLTGTDRWIAANTAVSPVTSLQNALYRCLYPVRDIVLGNYAFAALQEDPKFKDLIYTLYQTGAQSTIQIGPVNTGQQNWTYRGRLASAEVNLWTYDETYTDEATGTETRYLPQDYVLLIPSAEYGWRCHAAIWDAAANFQGMEYFFKNWMEEDPGIPFVMLQSAPMLAHTRIDSTVCIKTGATQPQGGK